MIHLEEGQEVPKTDNARKLLWFICDCGNRKQIWWKNYKSGHTKSCGKCKSNKFRDLLARSPFGMLTLDEPEPLDVNKRTVLRWKCGCGGSKSICVASVVNGLTKSCGCLRNQKTGRYVVPQPMSKKFWLLEKNGKLLDIGLPHEWSIKSGIVCQFKCDCGKQYQRKFFKHTDKSKCGKCDNTDLSSLRNKTFGKLTLVDGRDIEINKRSSTPIEFKCSCGNIKQIPISNVLFGNTTTCGNCNLRTSAWWASQKFGFLTPTANNSDVKLRSELLIECICRCGNVCKKIAASLTTGSTKSCGDCYSRGLKWWDGKPKPVRSDGGYSLEYLMEYFRGSFLLPLSGVANSSDKMSIQCRLCDSMLSTNLTWLYENKTVSCGCATNSTSKGSSEIGEFISKLGVNVVYGKDEYRVGKFKLDVFIPSKSLGVEYNGLRYHYGTDKRDSQLAKYRECLSNNIDMMVIFEDEWQYKRQIFERLIKNRLGLNKCDIKIRSSSVQFTTVKPPEAHKFHDSNHYQGSCFSTIHYGAYFNGRLIACMSLRKPSRQLAGDWEISRMSRVDDIYVHGVWSKILSNIIKLKMVSGKLITYSDNRLMSGNVYRSMGFSRTTAVKSDYYWAKGNKRYHKSALRKTNAEKLTGLTEVQLRVSQGYTQIFDLGKTKWEMTI